MGFIRVNELETFQQLWNVITGLGVDDDIGDIDFTQGQLGVDDHAHGIFVSRRFLGRVWLKVESVLIFRGLWRWAEPTRP